MPPLEAAHAAPGGTSALAALTRPTLEYSLTTGPYVSVWTIFDLTLNRPFRMTRASRKAKRQPQPQSESPARPPPQPRPAAVETPASALIEQSHAPPKQSSTGGLGSMLKSAGKFLLDEGLETLLTVGTSLLGAPLLRVQIDAHNERRVARGLAALPDGIIPMGTVIASVPLTPNFAATIDGAGVVTRLERKASTFLKYKFTKSSIRFMPAAGALNNGQIGFFVATDPRYTVTAVGSEAVRLVHEFGGVITQVSQKASVKIPDKGDFLYVEDSHSSDTRFTQQGVLWIIAVTDLSVGADATTGTTSLGEFSMDYHIELRDDALEGAVLAPSGYVPKLVFQGSGIAPIDQFPPTVALGLFAPQAAEDNPLAAGTVFSDTSDDAWTVTKGTWFGTGNPADACGLFLPKRAGVYQFDVFVAINMTLVALGDVAIASWRVNNAIAGQYAFYTGDAFASGDASRYYCTVSFTCFLSLKAGDEVKFGLVTLSDANTALSSHSCLSITTVAESTGNAAADYSAGHRASLAARVPQKQLEPFTRPPPKTAGRVDRR